MATELISVESRELLNCLPDAIVVVDSEGSIVSANELAEQIFGYPHGELLRQPVEILVPEAFREKHVDYRKAYVRDPKSRPMGAMELQARRKDGSLFPVEISL
ncbi:MAG: PAS domain S-box protein, partial [Terriglobia bacterium]